MDNAKWLATCKALQAIVDDPKESAERKRIARNALRESQRGSGRLAEGITPGNHSGNHSLIQDAIYDGWAE
jgi:hypothetical protein